ncbi:unnamed protein product [Chondrus crispus]|uniref:RNA helicase n=1 Tax=Chondrus crispus TaxID=2769 RepID=R7QA43_CHOCR|nr:unnamed protein product [Chondrus crispus]CDF34340.1 unnamed protein product [Chondrus crispus]|eukprot:XP_005714159.1 unnamed protein product [Chondrus crispus]
MAGRVDEPSLSSDLAEVQELLSHAHPASDVWTQPLHPQRHVYGISFLLSLRHHRLYSLSPSDPIRRVPAHLPALSEHIATPENTRTADVLLSGPDAGLTFSDLALPPPILCALARQEITHPSPVQLRALPAARLGADVIVQAKSGTGKTLVFGIVAAEAAASSSSLQGPAALLIAPTRELAAQIARVTQSLCDGFENSPHVSLFIGGCPEREDAARIVQLPPAIAVATPGRALALVERGNLRVAAMKLLVLDEADRLLDGSLGDTVPRICEMLPMRKQTLAFSATYPAKLQVLLRKVMRNATHIQVQRRPQLSEEVGEKDASTASKDTNAADPNQKAVLLGVRQRKIQVERGVNTSETKLEAKTAALVALIQKNPFSFCIVFTNSKKRNKSVVDRLSRAGFASADIHAGIRQLERTAIMKSAADGNLQVLVATDLLARGVDIDICDLVVHLDIPHDSATYLHRVGRAGRFGKLGLSVVIHDSGDEAAELHSMEKGLGFSMTKMLAPRLSEAVEEGVTQVKADGTRKKRKRSTDGGEGEVAESMEIEGTERGLDNIQESRRADGFESRHKIPEIEDAQAGDAENIDTSWDVMEDALSTGEPELTCVADGQVADVGFNTQSDEARNSKLAEGIHNVIEEKRSPEGKLPSDEKDGWSVYASRAYSEGYEEGYERAFRMAMQLRARLESWT